jgi:hypothetical protein
MYLFRGLARVFYFIQTRPAPKRTLLENESSSTGDRGVFELGAFQTGALELRLTRIEPHYNGKRIDNHIFACSKCDETQTYVFDRT